MEYNECGTLPLSYPRLRPACEPTPLYQLQRVFCRLAGSSAALKKPGAADLQTLSEPFGATLPGVLLSPRLHPHQSL